MIGVKAFPGIVQILHAFAETLRIRRERSGIERSCRCAADYLKRTMCAARHGFRNRLENADLIGGTRAATGEYQTYALLHWCFTPLQPAPVSYTHLTLPTN